MPRMRTLKPAFATSEAIAVLSIPCRLHFAMLWTYADDDGRGLDNPRLIKAAIWPLDDDVDLEVVEGWQTELAFHGRIVRYEAGGRRYFEVANFEEHQKPQKKVDSKYPATGEGVVLPPPVALRDSYATPPVALPPVGEGSSRGEVEVGEPTSSQCESRLSPADRNRVAQMACDEIGQRNHDEARAAGNVRSGTSHLAACQRSARTDYLAAAVQLAAKGMGAKEIADTLMRRSVPFEESSHPAAVSQRIRDASEGSVEPVASQEVAHSLASDARRNLAVARGGAA